MVVVSGIVIGRKHGAEQAAGAVAHRAQEGCLASAPFALVIVPFGMLFGVVGTEAGLNLVEVLGACAECLESWGGHPMAVGIALKKARLAEFRARFEAAIRLHRVEPLDDSLESVFGYLVEN